MTSLTNPRKLPFYLRIENSIRKHRISICNAILLLMIVWYVLLFFKILPHELMKFITKENPETIWGVLATVTILALLVNVIGDVYDKLHKDNIRYFSGENDPRYKAQMLDLLNNNNINHIKMIEFSSATVFKDIVMPMARRGTRIQLLICHPEKIHNLYQVERIQDTINKIHELIAEVFDKKNIEIRCYKKPASIRGRLYSDKAVCVGWYTYGSRVITGYKNLDPSILIKRLPYDVFGDKNALIYADPKSQEGKLLESMFRDTFEDMWEDAVVFTEINYEKELKRRKQLLIEEFNISNNENKN